MPQVPIIMPQLGESIAEATIVDIKVKPGDEVADDQEIIDVETNKAVMGVTTPCKGKIGRITVELKETYPVGAVLGYVEASEQDATRFAKHAPKQANRTPRGSPNTHRLLPRRRRSPRRSPHAPIRRSRQRARKKSARAMAMANGVEGCPSPQ